MSKKKTNDCEFGGKFDIIRTLSSPVYVDSSGNGYTYTYTHDVVDSVYIKRVLYNNPATIVFWSDDTKTVSKCHGLDTYSPEVGLMACCIKKFCGQDQFRNLIKDWVPEKAFKENTTLSLTDLRRAKKNKSN